MNSSGPLVFDKTRYNYGKHYSTSSGKYTAPSSGQYLLTVNLYTTGTANVGSHFIVIDGAVATYIREQPGTASYRMGITTIVLTLSAGQSIWVTPQFGVGGNNIHGASVNAGAYLYSWFAVSVLSIEP